MCGDLYCGSCGPAQGNGRCQQCGAWALDGGCADPVACERANAEQAAQEDANEAAIADMWNEMEREARS